MPKKAELSFEAKLIRLETIVKTLEDGQLSLEESLTLYEEGAKLLVASQKELEQAKQRISEWSFSEKEEDAGE